MTVRNCIMWFGYKDKMRQFYEAWLERAPGDKSIYHRYCEYLLQEQDPERALMVVRTAASHLPDGDVKYLEHLVKKHRRVSEAEYLLQFSQMLTPTRDDLMRYLYLLQRQGRLAKERPRLLAPMVREFGDAAYALRAELHRMDHEAQRAVDDYRQALKLNPAAQEFHDGLAVALYEAGQMREAREEERRGRHFH